jgi:hypothetical protein
MTAAKGDNDRITNNEFEDEDKDDYDDDGDCDTTVARDHRHPTNDFIRTKRETT